MLTQVMTVELDEKYDDVLKRWQSFTDRAVLVFMNLERISQVIFHHDDQLAGYAEIMCATRRHYALHEEARRIIAESNRFAVPFDPERSAIEQAVQDVLEREIEEANKAFSKPESDTE